LISGHYQTGRSGPLPRAPQRYFFLRETKSLAPYVHSCIIGAQYVQSQDELICNICDENPNLKRAPSQSQGHVNFFQDGWGFPGRYLQPETLVRLPFGLSDNNVWPCHGHVCPGVHGNEAWFITNRALGNQTRVTILMMCQLHRAAPWPCLQTIQQSWQYGRPLIFQPENCNQLSTKSSSGQENGE
jgi:hypothetical protein